MPLMEFLGTSTSIVALAAIAVAIVLACAIIAVPFVMYYLWHRRKMVEMRGTHSQHVETLNERINRLEKKCAALQEQVTDAHMLLSDERRELDKKLSKAFPEVMPPMPAIPEEPERKARSARKERTRE
jgi:hypothetical protein